MAVVILGTQTPESADLLQHFSEKARELGCGFSAIALNDSSSGTQSMVHEHVPIDAIKLVISTDPKQPAPLNHSINNWLDSGTVKRFHATDENARNALFDLDEGVHIRKSTCSSSESAMKAISHIEDHVQYKTDDSAIQQAWTGVKSRLRDLADELEAKEQDHRHDGWDNRRYNPHHTPLPHYTYRHSDGTRELFLDEEEWNFQLQQESVEKSLNAIMNDIDQKAWARFNAGSPPLDPAAARGLKK